MKRAGIKRELNRGGELLGGNGHGRFNGGRLKNLTGGSGLSAGRERGEIPVRAGVSWAAGSFLCWAERVPRGLFLYLISFLLFYFLISNLFPNLLQNVSI
jgi:hypothetical protein